MPSESTEFGFGDIVLVPFPFTDQTAVKRRPAVVISGPAYGREKPDLIVMAVTSQLRPAASLGEVWLQDWSGRLAARDQTDLRQAIKQIIG